MEETVIRGSLDSLSFACFYFHEGVMVAALASGLTAPERKLPPEVVRARLTLADDGARLADSETPLESLIPVRALSGSLGNAPGGGSRKPSSRACASVIPSNLLPSSREPHAAALHAALLRNSPRQQEVGG